MLIVPSSVSGRRIVVSGGTGLLGRALAERLVTVGGEVRILSRQRDPELPPGVEAVQWDARTPGAWGRVIDGASAVVHLAGAALDAGRWTEERKRRIRDSRVQTTRLLSDAIHRAAAPPVAFLQASAVGHYGPRGDEAIEEAARPGDDFLARLCVDWEGASEPLEARSRRVLMRFGIVLSRRGGALPKMALPFRLFVGGWLGSGDQGFSWIHLDDAVDAMIFLLEHDQARGPFNVTAPEPVSNRAFSRALARTLWRPCLFRVPAWALRLLYGEMADALLGGSYVVPQRLLEQGFRFAYPTVREALEEIYG